MKCKKLSIFFIFSLILISQNLFSQNIRNNIKPQNNFSKLTQFQKDERLWELCSKSSPDAHDYAEFNLLVKAGADINYIQDGSSWNLLYETIYFQNGFFVEKLCEAGCDVNFIYRRYEKENDTSKKNISDEQCLVYFAFDQNIDFSIIQTLVEYGSPLSFIDVKNQNNILAKAFEENYSKEEILYLLQRGATPLVKNTSRGKISPLRQPILYAVKTGDIEFVKAFLNHGAKLDVYSEYTCGCALNAAVYSNNIAMVQFCLDNGCSPKSIPDTMWSPLDYAISNRNYKMVELFKNNGLDINRINKSTGETTVMTALEWSDYDFTDSYRQADLSTCYFALQMGIDPLVKNSKGKTIIKQAISKAYDNSLYNTNCNTYLLFAQECIKVAKENGYIPDLLESIIINDPEDFNIAIKKLKKKELNFDPFFYEALTLKGDCVQLLFDNGFTPTKNAIFQNIYSGNLEALKVFYSNGVDFNNFESDGKSYFSQFIYYTLTSKSEACIEYILTHGYDINKIILDDDNNEFTSLGYFSSRSSALTRIFIKSGADLNLSFGNEKHTPLMEALNTDKKNALYLLEAGADIFAEDIYGETIFDNNNYDTDTVINYLKTSYSSKKIKTTNNLKIRDKDSVDSNLIDGIKQGTSVKFIALGNYDIIDGIKNFWIKIEYKVANSTRQGWCFAGYL